MSIRVSTSGFTRKALQVQHPLYGLNAGRFTGRHSHSLFDSSAADNFISLLTSKKLQIYISKLTDPYLNLSIEHHLLRHTPADSAVLFLYTNRPSIVIGRNQNPWLEVNLTRIRPSQPTDLTRIYDSDGKPLVVSPDPLAPVDLVRRRSGGGTVFHDPGNLNYCVISPSASFTRDKHAEMVVRAVRKSKLDASTAADEARGGRARVNERHDIVLDQGAFDPELHGAIDSEDMHRTPFESDRQPLKMSGSAYKMVRDRALHHGTCLIQSPNLRVLKLLLSSDAAAHISALGVDSVRSPVGNLLDKPGAFQTALQGLQTGIVKEFLRLYNVDVDLDEGGILHARHENQDMAYLELEQPHVDLADIQKGVEELRSRTWIYGQTPRFTFSSDEVKSSPEDKLPWAWDFPQPKVHIATKSGAIEGATIDAKTQDMLLGRRIYDIEDFTPLLSVPSELEDSRKVQTSLGIWLNKAFGTSMGKSMKSD